MKGSTFIYQVPGITYEDWAAIGQHPGVEFSQIVKKSASLSRDRAGTTVVYVPGTSTSTERTTLLLALLYVSCLNWQQHKQQCIPVRRTIRQAVVENATHPTRPCNTYTPEYS